MRQGSIILTILVLIGLFGIGGATTIGLRLFLVDRQTKQPFIPVKSTFSLQPPSQALQGRLEITQGTAQMYLRNADSYAPATSGATILIGESVVTGPKSEAVATVNGLVTITLEANAELTFANIFTEDTVLIQKSGRMTYTKAASPYPVAIRALHTLISQESGAMIVNSIDTDVSVPVPIGTVKIALVDTDNTTHVWQLHEGDRANIDDLTRTVYLLPGKESE
jgi:hypothetical protein